VPAPKRKDSGKSLRLSPVTEEKRRRKMRKKKRRAMTAGSLDLAAIPGPRARRDAVCTS
jgi:CelD/BcsL family acetyltransferase involved in cellulose biosynthesis